MTDIKFGRLEDLPLREAWKHEALQFTPWLAENIERLSEAIGVQLELTGTEVAVETFSADILARDLDGNVVLIENQLEQTDHTHLGQIMTYLAGLEAQTVIWIAPAFREPHLSAIRWLNEHTSDGFSFFAIKARVVRIGDSPYAPIFEVIEKPSAWERSLAQTRKDAETGKDAFSDVRTAFWTRYLERHPEAEAEGIKVQRGWNGYTRLADGDVLISVWIGERTAGIYVRGGWGERKHAAADRLGPHADILARKLGFETYNPEPNGHLFGERFPKSYQDESNWPEIIDWMEERRKLYVAAISEAIEAEQ